MEPKTVAQSIPVRRLAVEMHTEQCGCLQAVVNLQIADLPPVQVRQRIWRNPACRAEPPHAVGKVSVSGPHHVAQTRPLEKVRVEASRVESFSANTIQLNLLDPETRLPVRLWWVDDKDTELKLRGELQKRLERIEGVGTARVDYAQIKLTEHATNTQQLVQILRDAVHALQFAWNVEVTETVATFAVSSDLQSL